MSDDKPGLAAALAELQKELPHIGKDQTADTGSYSYEYADLTTISERLMPLLGKHGLAFMTKPTLKDGQFVLEYALLHKSGERESGDYPLPNGTPQQIGSAVSYGRRYCLCAVTGVAPGGSDDDGAAASKAQPVDTKQAELNAAKAKVKQQWETHMPEQPFDLDAVAAHFAEWSGGEILAEATPDRLWAYAEHLGKQEQEGGEA